MGLGHGSSLSWWNLTGGTDSLRTYIATNKVVQSGLVLNLDAGASTSYPGSGTTWTDLSDKISSATGGLPIYNTTDTIGAVKGTGTTTDTNASSLVLAIPMDGANNGTTFTDESANIKGSGSAKAITRINAITSTTQSKFYGSSGSFNNSNSYLSIPDSADFAFGTTDFTIELWAYLNSGSSLNFGQGDGGGPAWVLYQNTLYIGPGIWNYNFGPAGSVPTGRWFHYSIVRQGTNVYFYIDGIQYGPYTGPSSWSDTTDALTIGQARGSYTNGYIQDFRIYKGVAKYTSNFTPPGNPNNGTLTNGPTYSTANGGSIVFDGGDDYISIGSQSLVGSGNTPFSVELWFYNTKNWTSGDYSLPVRVKQDSEFFVSLYNPSATLNIFATFRGATQWGIPVTQSDYVNKWVCLTAVYNGGDKNAAASYDIYSNGIKLPTGTNNFGGAGGSSNCNLIGADGTSGCNAALNFYKGNISAYKVYNRALSAAEVSQNYNALRGRFGI